MGDTVPGALNFLNKGDQRLKALHNSLDSLFEICTPKTLAHKSDMQTFSQRRRGRCCGTKLYRSIHHHKQVKDAMSMFWTCICQTTKRCNRQRYLYLRPLPAVPPKPAAPWFQSVPIGRNQLAKMVPNMCSRAGIAGHKTNHSLRATAATDLYHANIPEKLIQERTGHKSVQALRVYQHTTEGCFRSLGFHNIAVFTTGEGLT